MSRVVIKEIRIDDVQDAQQAKKEGPKALAVPRAIPQAAVLSAPVSIN
jgi:hypothetical protein